MVNRRIGKTRFAKKKKLRISEKLRNGAASYATDDAEDELRPVAAPMLKKSSKKSASTTLKQSKQTVVANSLAKQKSAVLKRQAVERMVLKEHLNELKRKRAHTRKGEDAKLERREMGKYIRQLEKEQKSKHGEEMKSINDQEKQGKKKKALRGAEHLAEDADNALSASELKDMFAHLTS